MSTMTRPPAPDAATAVTHSMTEGWRRMVYLLFKGPGANVATWCRWGVILLLAGVSQNGINVPNFSGRSNAQDFPFNLPGGHALALWLVGLAIVVFVLGIAILYLTSRFRLVMLEGVIAGVPRVRGVFGRTARQGLGYFLVQLVANLVMLAVAAAVILPLVPSLRRMIAEDTVNPFAIIGLLAGALLVILPLALLLALFKWYLFHIVLPYLWLRDGRMGAAMSSGWRFVREHTAATALLVLGHFIGRILAWIASVAVACCTCVVWMIPAMLVGILAFVTVKMAPLAIITVPLIIALVLVIAWFFATVTAPISLFFRCWSLAFVAGLDPSLGTPAAIVPEPGPAPGPEPPPIAPEPPPIPPEPPIEPPPVPGMGEPRPEPPRPEPPATPPPFPEDPGSPLT